jgi:hypothetical protein
VYGGVDIYIHIFLTSALAVGEYFLYKVYKLFRYIYNFPLYKTSYA